MQKPSTHVHTACEGRTPQIACVQLFVCTYSGLSTWYLALNPCPCVCVLLWTLYVYMCACVPVWVYMCLCACVRVCAGSTGKLSIWEVASGRLLSVIESAHYRKISVLRFTEDGRHLVSGGDDAAVHVWKLQNIFHQLHSAVPSTYVPLLATRHGYRAGRERLPCFWCGALQLHRVVLPC